MGYCSGVAMVLVVVAMVAAMEGGVLCQYAGSDLEMFVDELPKISSIRSYGIHHGKLRSRKLSIGMYLKKWKFHRDLPETPVYVYGRSAAEATFPGPTIEAVRGVPTYVKWTNHLPASHILPWDPTVPTAIPRRGGVPTVVHLHGGAHEPASDGNPMAWFTAGFGERGPNWAKTTYTYPNAQPAGNLWYHDHALGLTRANLLAGLLGPYVLRDPPAEAGLGLPSGPEFDRHLVIADRSFNMDGSIYMNYTGNVPAIHPQWQPEYFGDTITVNGKAWPYLAVQRRRYRFRIINASNARYLRLALSNGMKFTVIGSDTSYLPKPVTTADLLLGPSEIYDVIVDFSACAAAEVELTNDAPYPFPMGSTVSLQLSKVMKFLVATGPTPCDTSRIPEKLSDLPPARTGEATMRRYIVLYENTTADGEPTELFINGKKLEDPATETPKSGSTEVWEVINLTGDNHPLHLHVTSIQGVEVTELIDLFRFADCMVRLNDAVACNVEAHAVGRRWAVPEHERTWKNTVKIEPGHRTTIVAKFNLVEGNKPYPFDATAEPGYYYHCHILDHEDNAMIRPLKLT